MRLPPLEQDPRDQSPLNNMDMDPNDPMNQMQLMQQEDGMDDMDMGGQTAPPVYDD